MDNNLKNQSKVICVIDDDEDFNGLLCEILRGESYSVLSFASATLFLTWNAENSGNYDLILTDVSMPGLTGYDLCKKVRAQSVGERIPIVMLTGNDPISEKAEGLNAGADDFIQKPFQKKHLLAKIQSLLNIRTHDKERLVRLTRFISPNIADLVVSEANPIFLKPHRALVTVMFIDLRGFTAFSESVEPEEVMEVLGQFYTAVGHASLKHHATLGHLAGDGMMLFLNDPAPIERHQEVGVRMAMEVRMALAEHKKSWQQKGYNIDFGIGLAEGHATIGGIGFDRFWQYSVIGPVSNFASRLCQIATDGQILISHRFLCRMGSHDLITEFLGERPIKGLQKSVKTNNVISAVAEEMLFKKIS